MDENIIMDFQPISFCTTSMNRLFHLEQTFMHNINANHDYPNVEFVLLNYGSTDNLDLWVQQNLTGLILQKKVVYVSTPARYFRPSHSRNVSFLAASGKILCNVDADNFIDEGFAFHINSLVREGNFAAFNGQRGSTTGRMACHSKNFMSVGGYNEHLVGYGYDDLDLRLRLRTTGLNMQPIKEQFRRCINHNTAVRIQHIDMRGIPFGESNDRNTALSHQMNQLTQYSNSDLFWGKATLNKNFSETINVGVKGPNYKDPEAEPKG